MRGPFIKSERAYSPEENAMMMELHERRFMYGRIASDLATAGFPKRSAGAVKRAIVRRLSGELKGKHPPRPPRPGQYDSGEPYNGDYALRERRRIERADARFCKAMLRERPRVGASDIAGTDYPHSITPPLSGKFSACGWVW